MTRTEKRLAEIKDTILQLENKGIRPTKNAVFDIVGGNRQRTFALYDQAMEEIDADGAEQTHQKNKVLIDSFPPPSAIDKNRDDLVRIAQDLPLIFAKAQEDQFCTLTKRHHMEIQALNAEHANAIREHKAKHSALEARLSELETLIADQAAEVRELAEQNNRTHEALAHAEASLAEEHQKVTSLQAALDEARNNHALIDSFQADLANLIAQSIYNE